MDKVGPVGSWLAALQMTAEKWTANSVPDSFVTNTVDAAQGPFKNAAQDVAKSEARTEVRERLRGLIAGGLAESDHLRHAAQSEDRRTAVPIARKLAALHADFKALEKSCEGSTP